MNKMSDADDYRFVCVACDFGVTIQAPNLKVATYEAVRRHSAHSEVNTPVCDARQFKLIYPDGTSISVKPSNNP